MLVVHRCPECKQLLWSEQVRDRHVVNVHGIVYDAEKPVTLPETRRRYLPAREPSVPPQDDEERCRWLFPVCSLLVEAGSVGDCLLNLPEELQDRFEYVIKYVEKISAAKSLARYQRKNLSALARAKVLTRVLARPDLGPAYADQELQRIRLFDSPDHP
jgi:hypothetical protein